MAEHQKPDILVIGGGPVGQKFCEEMVAAGQHERCHITLVCEESAPPYNRVDLHDILQDRTVDDLLFHPVQWYVDHKIELYRSDPALRVDTSLHRVTLQSGAVLDYNKLILATGSSPVIPAIEGNDLPGVFHYRTHADAEQIAKSISEGLHVAIIGGGVLGIELATVLRRKQLSVTVVESSDHVLKRHLDPESALVLATRLQSRGIKILARTRLHRISQNDPQDECALSLHLDSGALLQVDLLIFATGANPCVNLRADLDFDLGSSGGFLVDNRMQTSVPDVYAIGECAAHPQNHIGSIAPGFAMARTLARNFAGHTQDLHIPLTPFICKSTDASVGVITLGENTAPAGAKARRVLTHQGTAFRKLFMEGRRIVGMSSVGEWPELHYLQECMQSGGTVPLWRIWRFRLSGRLYSSFSHHANYLPDDQIVCHCMGISKGELANCFSAGHVSVTALTEESGAGSVCGTCKPALHAFLGQPSLDQSDTRTRKLFLASLAAFTLITSFIAYGPGTQPPPYSADMDTMFSGYSARQTGYFAAVLALLGLGVSLRKYWSRFRIGSLAMWRTIHAIVGLLCIATILVHTNLKLGENFNRLLMVDFLGLTLIGTVLGILMAGELRLLHWFPGLPVSTIRRKLTRLHRVVYSVFPLLLLFHILSSYYY